MRHLKTILAAGGLMLGVALAAPAAAATDCQATAGTQSQVTTGVGCTASRTLVANGTMTATARVAPGEVGASASVTSDGTSAFLAATGIATLEDVLTFDGADDGTTFLDFVLELDGLTGIVGAEDAPPGTLMGTRLIVTYDFYDDATDARIGGGVYGLCKDNAGGGICINAGVPYDPSADLARSDQAIARIAFDSVERARLRFQMQADGFMVTGASDAEFRAFADWSHTARWAGVLYQEGLESLTITSASGYDYGQLIGAPQTGGVPEPATWAVMLAGFGMLGGALRRRSAVAA